MAVLIPRIRTLGVRLSEDEYASLERYCIECGARSISDLARTAICAFVRRGSQENAASPASHVASVKDLEEKVERLSAEIAALRGSAVSDSMPESARQRVTQQIVEDS